MDFIPSDYVLQIHLSLWCAPPFLLFSSLQNAETVALEAAATAVEIYVV